MDLNKRREYKQFATWLNNNEYLTDKFPLTPYELAEMYMESDFYKQLPHAGNLLCGFFEPANDSSSATICKHCGREKWMH